MNLRWKDENAPKPQVRQKNGITWLSYPLLEQCPGIRNAFSTREGGVSEGIWSSMNLSYSRGDDPEHVTENFRRFAEAAGFDFETIVTSDQTHTTNVRCVGKEDCGSGITRPRSFHEIDGMITDTPGVVLATFYADCVPLYFVDPVKKVIGLSHSGWRGTVGKIGKKTVELMTESFGSDPADILACVGPSICSDCYEVSQDVIDKVKEVFDEALWESLFYEKGNGKYQLDLWKTNEEVFQEAGILPEHIAVTNVCTRCNSRILYSHRVQGDKRGNLCAFLALK